MDIAFVNVIILGFGFMFVFAAFQTMGLIEKTMLTSIAKEDSSFTGDGYKSLAIIYIVFSLCNWLAPSFISFTGPRVAMLVGAVIYTGFMVTFLFPSDWLLYLASGILGVGASIIWTGQGSFLSRCSTKENISRNSGIFWAMLQLSFLFGNLFVYFEFFNKTEIDMETRHIVLPVLTALAVAGIIVLALLRYVPDTAESTNEKGFKAAVSAFKAAGRLFITRNMLLLCVCFFYTGVELSFFSGVYSACIGFTLQIHTTPKELIGISGICIGVGEVIGGALFGTLGAKFTHFGRDPIVISGFIVHMTAYFLIFINLPDASPLFDTNDISFLDPPVAWIAIVCSFLLGFGDACFNTQCYSMLGGEYRTQSVGAFALFKFTQSFSAAAAFFYSSHVGLRIQLGILVVMCTLGTFCFVIVEWAVKGNKPKDVQNDTEKNKS